MVSEALLSDELAHTEAVAGIELKSSVSRTTTVAVLVFSQRFLSCTVSV